MIGRVAPFVLALDLESEGLVWSATRWQNRDIALRFSGHNGNGRLFWQWLEVECRDRISKNAKFKCIFTKCLEPHARPAKIGHAEANDDLIAFLKKAFHHLDPQRAVPRPNIAFRVPAQLQQCAVGGRYRAVVCLFGMVELRVSLI